MAVATLDDLVGRRSELAALRAAITGLVAGHGCAILVEGEPGIGKSAVIRSAADEATRAGCELYWASCDELSHAFALVPLLDALGIRETAKDPRRAAIARLMHADPGSKASGVDVVTAATERLLSLVDELCVASPVVIVVDDLQWADPATVQVWARLARSVAQVQLLLIGMMRPIPRRDDLLALRRLVAPEQRILLGGLPEPDVLKLVTTAVGGPPGGKLSDLASGAAGNPLYLTELCAALMRSSRLMRVGEQVELAAARAPARPTPLSVAVTGRLDFVSEPTRDMLHTAALLGVDFSVAELAVVTGSRVPDLMPALDEAIVAGVLHDDEQGLAFRHPLIRAALYDSVPSAVRAAWHADAGRALAAGGAPVDRVARQLLAALDDPTRATGLEDGWLAEWLVTVAAPLVGRAPQAAVPLLRAAARGRGAGPTLAVLLADALYRMGEAADAERVAVEALAEVTDPDVLVDLHWTRAQCLAALGRAVESVETLETALASQTLEQRHRARLKTMAARAHRTHGDVDVAVRLATEASAEAEAVGDRWAVSWAHAMLALVKVMRGQHDEALLALEQTMTLADGDPTLADLSLLMRVNRAVVLGDLDRYEEAIAAAQEIGRLADEAGNVVRLSQAHSVLTELMFDSGRWDDALTGITHVDGPIGHSPNALVECMDHGIAATILLHRGDTSAHEHLTAATPFAAMIGSHRVVAPLALARSLEREHEDAFDDALAVLTAALADGAEEQQETEDLLADTVRLAVATGRLDAARSAIATAKELAADLDIPRRRAVAQHCRGLLDNDPDALAAAAADYVTAARPLPAAQANEAAGIALAVAGDLLAGRRHFTDAFDGYASLGATWDLARLQARFRKFGIRRGSRAGHRRARTGWDSLTQTEVRIAHLVARGMSNPAIAAELFLSRRTVQTHVSHILVKLSLRSRIDIARQVSEREA
jgi:DNA-binding CsgD family transcriptional regulator/tetratricopeptide (TPR) repeat protein